MQAIHNSYEAICNYIELFQRAKIQDKCKQFTTQACRGRHPAQPSASRTRHHPPETINKAPTNLIAGGFVLYKQNQIESVVLDLTIDNFLQFFFHVVGIEQLINALVVHKENLPLSVRIPDRFNIGRLGHFGSGEKKSDV